jgi:hypothetical protein
LLSDRGAASCHRATLPRGPTAAPHATRHSEGEHGRRRAGCCSRLTGALLRRPLGHRRAVAIHHCDSDRARLSDMSSMRSNGLPRRGDRARDHCPGAYASQTTLEPTWSAADARRPRKTRRTLKETGRRAGSWGRTHRKAPAPARLETDRYDGSLPWRGEGGPGVAPPGGVPHHDWPRSPSKRFTMCVIRAPCRRKRSSAVRRTGARP